MPFRGYPEYLERVHDWMIFHQDLLPGPPPPSSSPPLAKLSTGANQRISGSAIRPRSESDIINPWNSSGVIAASNDLFTGGANQVQYYSTNGGLTWGQTFLPLQPGDSFHADPAVDWTSNGTAWSTTLGIAIDASGNSVSAKIQLYKSTNGGTSWVWDSTLPGGDGPTDINDKPMFWIDHSNVSPYKNNLYTIWSGHSSGEVSAFVNRKNGPTGIWSPAVEVSTDPLIGGTNGTDIKTNAYGDVFAFYPRYGSAKLLVAKSVDGGLTFSPPAAFASVFGSGSFAIGGSIEVPAAASLNHGGTILYISAAAYRTSTQNNVYAVWRDLSGEPGCTDSHMLPPVPGTNVLSTCKTRIWFTRSTNGGTIWEAARMINNQSSLNDQFNPHLVVDETNGTLGLMYYDTVADPGRKKADIWYQSSYDGGVTWGSPTKVTTAQSDESQIPPSNPYQYGDYNGMAAYNGTFIPSWTDSRNGIEEIWAATIFDNPAPAPRHDRVGTAKPPPNSSEFRLMPENLAGGNANQTRAGITGITGLPVAGDWNGDGIDTIGNFDPTTATFALRNINSVGSADITFVFGTAGAGLKAIAGDWNGDHVDTVGVYDPATQTFFLRNSNSAGLPDITFTFTSAASTWLPIAGDWDGNGITTVGLYDPATSTFYLRNSNTTGGADLSFVFGTPNGGLLPLAGDWDGDGRTTIGLYNSLGGPFQLRNQNSAGPPDLQFADTALAGGAVPVAGNWSGN